MTPMTECEALDALARHFDWPEGVDVLGQVLVEDLNRAGFQREQLVGLERLPREQWRKRRAEVVSKYHREIKPGVFVDVYDVLRAWGVTNPALQHLIKKALQPGERGHKTLKQDMADIVASAKRAEELERE